MATGFTTSIPSQMHDPFSTVGSFGSPATSAANPFGGLGQQQPSQEQAPTASDNPFAAYANPSATSSQQQSYNNQQQAMVQSAQPTNQWGMQQQPQQPQPQPTFGANNMTLAGQQQQTSPTMMPQQQAYQQHMFTPQQQQQQAVVPSSGQSINSYGNYMTPSAVGQGQFMSPVAAPPPPPNQNMYSQQPGMGVQVQQPGMVQQPPEQPPAPPAPTPVADEDDDFFGAFSNNVKAKEASSPPPPSEFDTGDYNDYNENVSVLSKSTNGTDRRSRTGASALDDPRFAPKPKPPHGLENARKLSHNAPPGSSPLPDFDLVTHSGYSLARISFRTILIKKWKQIFWVSYGDSKVLIFRSSADFEDWISNPYLTKAQRDFLVKLEIDVVQDMFKPNIRGYQTTNQRLKAYNSEMLYQFKLERWMDYGPTIAAAFGSRNEREIYHLRTIFGEMIKRAQKSHAVSNRNASPVKFSHPGHQHYSSSQSTGRMYEQRGGSVGGSVHSRGSHVSYGHQSTGPVEMSRNPQGAYRSQFQY